MAVCTHLDQIKDVTPSTTEGCTECLKTGDHWVHLRECLSCGHVGCCDSSPNRHATAHFHETIGDQHVDRPERIPDLVDERGQHGIRRLHGGPRRHYSRGEFRPGCWAT